MKHWSSCAEFYHSFCMGCFESFDDRKIFIRLMEHSIRLMEESLLIWRKHIRHHFKQQCQTPWKDQEVYALWLRKQKWTFLHHSAGVTWILHVLLFMNVCTACFIEVKYSARYKKIFCHDFVETIQKCCDDSFNKTCRSYETNYFWSLNKQFLPFHEGIEYRRSSTFLPNSEFATTNSER